MMNHVVHPEEAPKRLAPHDYLKGIRELFRTGEITNLGHWGDGKFAVGENGKWHYEGFINLFQGLHEAMRAVDPTIPPALPPHCLDPEVIANFFGIPLKDMNWQGQSKGGAKPETAKPVNSPYLTAEEGAAYLRTTVLGIYSLVKRGRLHPMPGRRILLFTRESLDKSMATRRRRRR
jgi:hypothetical protein